MSTDGRKPSRHSPSVRRMLTGTDRGNGIHPASKLRRPGDEESRVGSWSPADDSQQGDTAGAPPPSTMTMTPGGTQRSTHVTMDTKLAIFRALTGINTEHGLTILKGVNRPVSNVGIYTKVVAHEKRAGREYRFFRLLINVCLGLQLIVAAALTALGAGNGPRALVTAFGAINTVIAGFLTYLKNSGLPNRKRYYLNEWGKVRQYIEQREREFCLDGCELDVDEEILKVEAMYDDVMIDIEANTPDSYTGNKNAGASSATKTAARMPPSSSSASVANRDHDEGSDSRLSRNNTRRSFVKVPEKVEEQKAQT